MKLIEAELLKTPVMKLGHLSAELVSEAKTTSNRLAGELGIQWR